MKKLITNYKVLLPSLLLLSSGAMYAQVGVNNAAPQATMDITGHPSDNSKIDGVIAPRITGEQLKSKDNLYTAAQDGTIVYVTQPLTADQTTNKTANVVNKAYYYFDAARGTSGQWVVMTHQYPVVASGAVSGSANTGNPVTVSSVNSSNGTATLVTKSFTLTKPGLVTFTFSIPITNVTLADGSTLSGGSSKLMAANVFLTGPGFNNYLIVRSGISIVNSNTGSYTNSGYQVNGSRTLTLQPGTYTVMLNPLVYAQDNTGIKAVYGDNSYADTVFDIVVLPMP